MNETATLTLTFPPPSNDTGAFANGSHSPTDTPTTTTTPVHLLLQELAASLTEDLLPNASMWASDHDNATDSEEASSAGSGRVHLSAHSPVQKFLEPVVCTIGIVLNVLNLLVLTERCLKESPYTYLTAMAVLCLASLVMSLLQNVCMQSFRNNYYCFVYTFHVYFPCVNICSNSTMWLIVTLTIERFLFIKHPLWARAKCDRRSAKIKIGVVIVLMFVLNIPRFLFYKVVPDKEKGPGYYTSDSNHFRLSQTGVVISWIYSVIIQMIPMSILCVLNVFLVYAVHRARRLRQHLHIRSNMEAKWTRDQTRLTVTLITIVFFFLVCIMPSAFSSLHVAYAFFGRGQSRREFCQSRDYRLFMTITNELVFCQLSFNFVPFSAFNNKFRAVFKRMLRRWAEQIRRCVSGQHSSRSMRRLMRLDAAQGGGGGGGGIEIIGHNNNNNNDRNKLQLRSSSNTMSSGKDSSQTKSSMLEIAS